MIDGISIAKDVVELSRIALKKEANLGQVTHLMGQVENHHPEQLQTAIHLLMHYITDYDLMEEKVSYEKYMNNTLNKSVADLKKLYGLLG